MADKKNICDKQKIHHLMLFVHVSYNKTCLAAIDPEPVDPEVEMSLLYFT